MNLRYRSGFTLVELLLSISIIAILTTVVIIAINPTRQIGQATETSDLLNSNTIRNSLNQYFAENTGYPTAINSLSQMICSEGHVEVDCISLEGILTPIYLGQIPQKNNVDPPYSGYYVRIAESGDVSVSIVDETVPAPLRDPEPKRAYAFDGVNDYIDSTNSALQITGNMTISAWVKPSSDTANQTIIASSNGGQTYYGLTYGYTDGKLSWWNTGGGEDVMTSAINIANTWTHVAAVRSGSTVTLYVNGVSAASGAVPTTSGTGTLSTSIGRFGSFSGLYFSGSTMDTRVYNSALSGTDIALVYAFSAVPTLPIVWYKSDDTHTTVAYDSSGNSRNGTKTNVTPASFHYSGADVPYSYQNTVGFTLDELLGYIPRNESSILYDVLGGILEFSGPSS